MPSTTERHVVHRERSRGQYGGPEYLLAKLIAELPLDASFAAAFGLLLKRRCGLRAATPALVSLRALSAAHWHPTHQPTHSLTHSLTHEYSSSIHSLCHRVQVGLLSLSAACCAALGLAVGALVPGQVTTFYVLTYLLTH